MQIRKLHGHVTILNFIHIYPVFEIHAFFFLSFFLFYRVNYVSRIRREESYSKTATSGAMDSGNYYSRCYRNFASSCVFIAPLKYFSCISPVINFTGKNMKVIYLGKNILKCQHFLISMENNMVISIFLESNSKFIFFFWIINNQR